MMCKRFLLSVLSLLGLCAAQIQCPDGYNAPTTYTGFCYKFNSGTMTWNAHENACTQVTLNGQPYAGGHLATIFDLSSATVVMNQYCNNLNAGHPYFFIGYYCISSSYTSRLDWRWTSGKPTTWLHSAPTYLSGAEPDDFGCGLAHYSDDGANAGRVGDWSCSRALKGGCCEAPVIPTPSSSISATQTATSTATSTTTRTRTASQTETSSQTATNTITGTVTNTGTYTRTGSKTSTETRTATATATSTNTATATVTPTESSSVSPSSSPSVSESVSPSASASVSQSMSVSVTPTISITLTPRPVAVGAALGSLGEGGSSALMGGVGAGDDSSAAAAAESQKTVIVASVSGAGALALLLLLCGLWFCCLVHRRRRAKENTQRARLVRPSRIAAGSKLVPRVKSTGLADTLGSAAPVPRLAKGVRVGFAATPAAAGASMSAMFGSMNPTLINTPQRTSAAPLRDRRMTTVLSAYKNTSAFKPVAYRNPQQNLLLEMAPEVQTEALMELNPEDEDTVVGITDEQEQEEEEEIIDENVGSTEYADESLVAEDVIGIQEETAEDVAEEAAEEAEDAAEAEDDYVDEDETLDGAVRKKVVGASAVGGGWLQNKQKKATESAVAPPIENKKLVIGRGALLTETVEKQTVKLRRVSKVRGDKDLTAIRQGTAGMDRVTRPSVAARGLFEPQRPTSYAFTATVSRTVVKTDAEHKPVMNSLYENTT